MNYLHVAIMEDSEECLISTSEVGLRRQVTKSMTDRFLTGPTDAEWAFHVLSEGPDIMPMRKDGFGMITYYKTESRLEA